MRVQALMPSSKSSRRMFSLGACSHWSAAHLGRIAVSTPTASLKVESGPDPAPFG